MIVTIGQRAGKTPGILQQHLGGLLTEQKTSAERAVPADGPPWTQIQRVIPLYHRAAGESFHTIRRMMSNFINRASVESISCLVNGQVFVPFINIAFVTPFISPRPTK